MSFAKKLDFLEDELLKHYANDDPKKAEAKQKVASIKHQFKKGWLAARKMKSRFEKNNRDWRNGIVSLPALGMYVVNKINLTLFIICVPIF